MSSFIATLSGNLVHPRAIPPQVWLLGHMVSVDTSTSVLAMTVSFGMVWNMPYSEYILLFSNRIPLFPKHIPRLWSQRQPSHSAFIRHGRPCHICTGGLHRLHMPMHSGPTPRTASHPPWGDKTRTGAGAMLAVWRAFPFRIRVEVAAVAVRVRASQARMHRMHAPVASCISHLPTCHVCLGPKAAPRLDSRLRRSTPFVQRACVCVRVRVRVRVRAFVVCLCSFWFYILLMFILLKPFRAASAKRFPSGKRKKGISASASHLHQDWAHRCHICIGTGLTAATSASGLGSPLPHLHGDWPHRCHICTGTGLTTATSTPGLRSPLPHRHRDWARPSHICSRTGPTAATSAPGLGSPCPHLL